jgi:O-antigen/teichoic acid export membrane protein
MSEQQSSYRQIMKATSLFGGVQVLQIFVQIIRSKFVAILLGPAGMGITGLLTTTLGLIGGLTNFGLGTSAVKDISMANSSGNETRIALVTVVLQRVVWISGILGAIITLMLSLWLSQLTFGNKDYTFAFVWLSITLLFNQLSVGQLVLLQSLRKLQYLAKANLYGSIWGLFITIPLYYKFRIDGIVPGIIVTSVLSLFLSWFYARKINIKPIKVSKLRTVAESKNMLTMGFVISISSLINLGVSYIVRIFISRHGGIEDVGLFNAGFVIINTYVGLIFTAMGTDYLPRLSAVSDSNSLSKTAMNQQAEVALLILAPILIVFLVFINWAILLLYSRLFIAVNTMIYWAALGMFFKSTSWAIAFIFLAKGTSKLFFWSELIANTYTLILNLLGYYYLGLTGLGLSFMLGYFLYLIQVYFIAKLKFEFEFENTLIKIFIFQFALALCSFLAVKFLKQPYPYVIGTVLVLISTWYSFTELDKRIGVIDIAREFINNLNFKNKGHR